MPRDGRWREMEAAKFRIRDFVVKISTKSAPIRTTSKPFARFAAHEAAPESALEDFRKKFPEVLVGKPPRRPVSVRRKPPRRKPMSRTETIMAKELKAMTVRIDADVYERATEVFAALGTDLTSAIRVFVNMAVEEGGFPFTPRIPRNGSSFDTAKGLPSNDGLNA